MALQHAEYPQMTLVSLWLPVCMFHPWATLGILSLNWPPAAGHRDSI